MKICKKCRRMLSYESFTKSKNIKDGYENTCRKCRGEARKVYKFICDFCNKSSFSSVEDVKYCSAKCAGEARRKRVEVICSYCRGTVEIIESKERAQAKFYCNQACRSEHLKQLMKGEGNPNFNRIDYKCDGCSKDINIIPSKLKKQKYIFCSNDCYRENIGRYFLGALNPNYNHREFICEKCKGTFKRIPSANRGDRIFCSRECYGATLSKIEIKAKINVSCPICNTSFQVWRSRLNYSVRTFCSRECANKGQSKFFSGENSPMWNPRLSQEERLRARKYEEYYLWRKEVFKRDYYTCQRCGDDTGGNLIAHHILNYSEHPDLRTELTNGITLCEINCHKAFHDKYGYINNNQQQLDEFIYNYEKNI